MFCKNCRNKADVRDGFFANYKILTLILTLVMSLTVICQPIEASAASAKPVAKASQKVISKGTKTQLKVTYNKKNVTSKAKFKSSNKKVATVSKKGIVTGKKAGTVYITATYKGKTSKKVKLTVAQVSLNKKSVKLTVGKTTTLTAKYNGKKIKPTYKSSNANVASVNKNGKITAKKKGTATITANYKKSKVTCKVTVSGSETGCASGHTYDKGIITKQPTCIENGVKIYTCTKCGNKKTETVKALGHAWDDGVITTKPADGKSGVKTYTCTRCGETRTEAGHYEKKKVKDAWDEEVTEDVQVCNGCGKTFGPTEYGSAAAADNAVGEHIALADFDSDCDSYHSEERTYTIHHEAEYEDVWVAD